MESDSLFEILCLPLDSSPKTVRKKCQELLLRFHPDKNHGQESEEFLKISDVWKKISSYEDLSVLLRKEKSRRTNISNTNPNSQSDEVRFTDMRIEEVDFDGSLILARTSDCRCGGVYLITKDTIDESELVNFWTIECDTCSLMIRVTR